MDDAAPDFVKPNSLVLGLRSWYSGARGFLSPADAVNAAKTVGASCVAFADYGEMAGYLEFMEAAHKAGVAVVPGVEVGMDFEGERFSVQLYAAGAAGIPALLAAYAKTAPPDGSGGRFRDLPLLDNTTLGPGLVIVSPGGFGPFGAKLFQKDKRGMERFCAMVRGTGASLVCGIDPITVEPLYHDLLAGVRGLAPYRHAIIQPGQEFAYRDICRVCFQCEPPDEAAFERPHIMTQEQWRATALDKLGLRFDPSVEQTFVTRFAILPDAIVGVLPRMEHVSADVAESDQAKLAHICQEALDVFFDSEAVCRTYVDKEKRAQRRAAYQTRIEQEVVALAKAGLAGRILALRDAIVKTSAGRRVDAPPIAMVRGSAANSLVFHILGMSPVNSLAFGIPFERFLSEERQSPPDIDIDVSPRHAASLHHALANRLPNMAALRMFNPPPLIGILTRALDMFGVKGQQASRIRKMVADAAAAAPTGIPRTFVALSAAIPTFRKDFLKCGDPTTMSAIASVLDSVGERPLAASRHVGLAAGSVRLSVFPQRKASDGVTEISVPFRQAEALGLEKIDLLPNRHLAFLDVLENVLAASGVPPQERSATRGRGCFDDVLSAGRVTGIFQFASRAELLRVLAPSDIHELAAACALIRLAGRSSSRDVRNPLDAYIACSKHPSHAPHAIAALGADAVRIYQQATAKTRGVVVFQEQMMTILHGLSGMPLNVCEALRRAIAKKSRNVADITQDAVAAIADKHKCPQGVAQAAADAIFHGGTYLFNQGHAYAYAHVALREAAAKYEHTAEFLVATVRAFRRGVIAASQRDFRDMLASLSYETMQLGVSVLPLDFSKCIFTQPEGSQLARIPGRRGTRDAVRLGLDAIADVTNSDLARVEAHLRTHQRPPGRLAFDSPESLAAIGVSADLVTKVVSLGAFDFTGRSKREMLNAVCGGKSLAPLVDTKAAMFATFGFYPVGVHPGLPLKRTHGQPQPVTPGAMSTVLSRGVSRMRVTGFFRGAPSIISRQDCIVVSIDISGRMGDAPVRLSRRFLPSQGELAQRLRNDLSTIALNSPDVPVTLNVEGRQWKGRIYWNIPDDPDIRIACASDVVPLDTLVDVGRKKMGSSTVSCLKVANEHSNRR